MRKFANRVLTLVLLSCMILGVWAPAASAASYRPTVTLLDASDISESGAQLNAYVACPQRYSYDNVGFYLSPNKTDLNTHRYTTNYTPKTPSFDLTFSQSRVKGFCGVLNPGSIYYYKLFVELNGVEYATEIGWFRTQDDATADRKGAPTVAAYDAVEITMDSATLRGGVMRNPLGLTFSKIGLLMGTSRNSMSEVASNTAGAGALPQVAYYVNRYKTLAPLTTYYYQFFAVTKAGASYASPVKSFTTLAPYHTVTFQPNGGLLTQMNAVIVYPGQPYAFSEVPYRQGYTFAGWYTLPNGGSRVENSGVWMYDADVTLYAMWMQGDTPVTGGELLVYFDLNYDNLGATQSKTVQAGKKYGTLPEPTRTGYKFAGWYTARENGTRVKSSTKAGGVGVQTLYALWTPREAQVKFHPNGGSVSPKEAKLAYGTAYALPVPVREGYTFVGWNTARDGSGSMVLTNTPWVYSDKITLYAQWTQPLYTNATPAPQGGTTVVPVG
ncbi:MAG: InlB B-repeat-containing protein [Clostridia bacterium]|nr:InlB B-repeat-containing protein [Clostridia bacterium]